MTGHQLTINWLALSLLTGMIQDIQAWMMGMFFLKACTACRSSCATFCGFGDPSKDLKGFVRVLTKQALFPKSLLQKTTGSPHILNFHKFLKYTQERLQTLKLSSTVCSHHEQPSLPTFHWAILLRTLGCSNSAIPMIQWSHSWGNHPL